VRPLRIAEAIDLYLGELARAGRAIGTIDEYGRKLNLLADDVRDAFVHEIALADYERFLNRWLGKAASTMASSTSTVKGFSEYLWRRGTRLNTWRFHCVGPPDPGPRTLMSSASPAPT
jgi:hypothetical protein